MTIAENRLEGAPPEIIEICGNSLPNLIFSCGAWSITLGLAAVLAFSLIFFDEKTPVDENQDSNCIIKALLGAGMFATVAGVGCICASPNGYDNEALPPIVVD